MPYHENHWNIWYVLVQVQRLEVGCEHPRERRDSNVFESSELWNRAVFRLLKNGRLCPVSGRLWPG